MKKCRHLRFNWKGCWPGRGVGTTLAVVMLLTLGLESWVQADSTQTDSQYFPRTGKNVVGPFLSYWRENGADNIFGAPITSIQMEVDHETGQSYLTQWFERARFELQPKGTTTTVVLGKLGLEVRSAALKVDPDFLPASKLTDPAILPTYQHYFDETKHNLRNRFLEYWNAHGSEERLGLPISEEHLEFDQSSRNYYLVQWFERARLEYHPENSKNQDQDIQLGLLGSQLKSGSQDSRFDYGWKLGHRSNLLQQPNSLYLDRKGNLYVNDASNGRINKYDATGTLINYWFRPAGSQAIAGLPLTSKSNENKNDTPDGPVLYQVGLYQNKVYKLTANGEWQTVELADAGDADATTPNQGLAVDGSGNIFILKFANQANFLVWQYDPQGLFVGKYVSRAEVNDPTGLAVANNTLYLADGAGGQARLFNLTNNKSSQSQSDSGPASGQPTDQASPPKFSLPKDGRQPNNALAIALDEKGNLLLGTSGQVFEFSKDGLNSNHFSTFGRGPGQLYYPAALALNADGSRLYVADPVNHRVTIFDRGANPLGDIHDEALNENGRLTAPQSLAVTPGSNSILLVADPATNRIQPYDLNGVAQERWTADKIGVLATGPKGEVYGLDSVDGLIVKYNAKGEPGEHWGGLGEGNGQFNLPTALAVDRDGFIYVSDTGNQRIQKLNSKGEFVTSWGGKGAANGKFGGGDLSNVFDGPASITVDPRTNYVYVVDPANARLQKFDADGHFLKAITSLDPMMPFQPVAVAAPVAAQNSAPAAATGVARTGLIFVATRQGIYTLDQDDAVSNSLVANVTRQGLLDGDTGDGNVNNLTGLAADGNGNLFATDSFGRVEKFRLVSNQ